MIDFFLLSIVVVTALVVTAMISLFHIGHALGREQAFREYTQKLQQLEDRLRRDGARL